MKNLLLFASLLMVVTTSCSAQGNEKRKSPHDTVSNANVSVTYGRPYMKGRTIFGSLVKYGEVWRTGADEATEITFKKDGTIAGKPVKAGTYTLFTIPGEKEWTIILNGKTGQWGAYDYEKNKAQDVLKVNVPAGSSSAAAEQLTITLPANAMVIAWDKTQVSVPLGF
jgi:hypothetical protein